MLKIEKEAALAAANAADSRQPVNPRYLKIPTAVAYTGLSRSTIYELLNAAKIKSHRIGAIRLIDRVSLEEFISSQPSGIAA